MTSKKKPIGCTSVRCVCEAIQVSGKTMLEFFRQAMSERTGKELQADIEKFEFLRRNHEPISPAYKIPKRVLDLADTVLKDKKKNKKANIQKPASSFSQRPRAAPRQAYA